MADHTSPMGVASRVATRNAPSKLQISLHRRQASLSQYQSTCISKHYALNHQILAAFEAHYRNDLMVVAYQLGMKFVETALLEIPKHGYFYSKKFHRLRALSSRDSMRVIRLLQGLLAKDPELWAQDCHKLERLHSLGEAQCNQEWESFKQKRLLVETELLNLTSKEHMSLDYEYHDRIGFSPSSSRRRDSALNSNSTLLVCGDSFASAFAPQPSSSSSASKRNSRKSRLRGNADSNTASVGASSRGPHAKPSTLRPPDGSDWKHLHRGRDDHLYPRPEQREPEHDGTNNSKSNRISLYPQTMIPSSTSLINSTDLESDDDDEAYVHVHHHDALPSESATPSDLLPPSFITGVPLYRGIPIEDDSGDPAAHQRQPVVRTQSEYHLQRALFLSGLQVALPEPCEQRVHRSSVDSIPEQQLDELQSGRRYAKKSLARPIHDVDNGADQPIASIDTLAQEQQPTIPFAPPGAKRRVSDFGISMDMLATCYHEDFDSLRDHGRIIVSQVPTYQGRLPDSTNGCTIIAPLLCIHHFHNDYEIPDQGLPDQTIVQVIDEETPSILPLVRQSLGLVPNAFLIPVDAHESLIEQQYMCQEQFLTVCGGNILEEDHLEPLLEKLSTVGDKKLAATFFFHEHVITIMQLRRTQKGGDELDAARGQNEKVWFDVIDSLPHEETLLRGGETVASQAGGSGSPIHDSFRFKSSGTLREESDVMTEDDLRMLDSVPPPPEAVRMRCLDTDSLRATLRWYACSVFSAENRAYIDTYQWDETLPDFDPRVFQAFLWQEAS